jgi:glyoxylase-like metal-dependent hydrolase (beta-lactamase superfamily II)
MSTTVEEGFIAGVPLALMPGLQRVLAANAGSMTGPGTNTYLLGVQEVWIIDPGPRLPAHALALMTAIGDRRVAGIVVTHTHPDHSPLAVEMHQLTGAPRIGALPRDRAHHDATFQPEITASDGMVLQTDVGPLTLLATPGHASNHFCPWWARAGVLFSGDHVLQGVTPVILPPDGDMSEYLASLRRLQALPLQAIAPGHGGLIENPQQNLAALVAHRLKREAKVALALHSLASGAPVAVEALLPLAYDDVPLAMHGWARHSLLAHLLKLAGEGRATCHGEPPATGQTDLRLFGLPVP